MGTHIKTTSGIYVNLTDLQRTDVCWKDVDPALDRLVRFTGQGPQGRGGLTVRRHSYMVHDLLPCVQQYVLLPDQEKFLCRLFALLHDTPEAYYGDISTPVKSVLGDQLREFTAPIDKVVLSKLGKSMYFSEEIHRVVKLSDLLALDIERSGMWPNTHEDEDTMWPPVPYIMHWNDKIAMFERYVGDNLFGPLEVPVDRLITHIMNMEAT